MNYQGAIESLLFVAGEEGIAISELVNVLNSSVTSIEDYIQILQKKYDTDDSGLAIVKFADKYQMVTKGKYASVIKAYATSPFASKLSQASLETLTIIAYKQPITRSKIDDIRGVQSTNALQKLQLRDLIEIKGREESPGKPILYGTTDYFLNYFGIQSLSDLPDISDIEMVTDAEITDLFNQRYQKEIENQTEE